LSCVGLIHEIFWQNNPLPKDFLDPSTRIGLPKRENSEKGISTTDYYLYFWKNNNPDLRVKLYNEIFGTTAENSHYDKMHNTVLDLKSLNLNLGNMKITKPPEPSNFLGFKFPDLKFPELPKLPDFKFPEMPKLPNLKLPDLKFPELPKFPAFKIPEMPKSPELPKSSDLKIPEMPKSPDFKIPDLNIPVMPKFPNP
jgi:hypothetical protein